MKKFNFRQYCSDKFDLPVDIPYEEMGFMMLGNEIDELLEIVYRYYKEEAKKDEN